MSVDADHRQVLARLESAIASGHLAGTAQAQAQRLLDRLQTGVRVVVIGPKGSGKSSLCAMLLGVALPDAQDDAVAHLFVGGPAGAVHKDLPAASGTVSRISLPLDLLQHLQIMDVAGSDDPAVYVARLRWAIEEADMVLWCASAFTARDAEFWADVPDTLKDHSFLVLTAADRLADAGTLNDRISTLQRVASEEFHSLFPTSCKAGCDSLRRNGRLSDALAVSSGVKGLLDVIRKLAASGRQADLDGALLFLQRHSIDSAPLPAESPQRSLPAAPRIETYSRALELLRARGADLMQFPVETIEQQATPFLAWCGALSEDLSAMAAEETSSCTDFHVWREDLYAAADKLVLMSMENDLRSAADAASILLQIDRELQARAGP